MTSSRNIPFYRRHLRPGAVSVLALLTVLALRTLLPAPLRAAALPGAMDPPVSNGINNVDADEDDDALIINLWDVFEDDVDPDNALVFTITGNTNPTLILTSIDNATGLLTVSFAADEFGSGDVTVRATDTGGEFTDASFQVNVSAVNDVPSFTLGTPPIVNEDAGAQTVSNLATSISPGPANESGQIVSFAVTSNTNSSLFSVQPVVSSTGVLTYTPAANLSGSAVITIVLSDDGGTDNGGVDESAPQNFTITVNAVNDEPSFTKGANINVNEDSGAFSQSNWATNLNAGPNETSQILTFNLSLTNTQLFTVQPAISSTGTLSFTPAPGVSGTSTVTVSIMDDGGTANGGDNESPEQTFTITINGVNDPPTTSGISDHVDLEDASNSVINLFSAFDDAEDADASLTYVELTNTNPALFNSTTISPTAGTYTMDYAPDANGSSVITIRVTDTGGLFVDESFTVTVTAVNDEPMFVKGADQVVGEDAPFQTVTGWATGISAGPANEVSQTLTFTVTTNNPALFQSAPAVSSAGTLTYHPVANTSGAAIVTVTLMDSGGTANGGDNQSPSQTFNITVSGENDPPTSTPIPNVQVVEDAAPQVIDLFSRFSDIEDTDTALTYTLQNNTNPALFGVLPPISSANGLLTLVFAPDANGSATLTVRATDTGGLFTEQSFNVDVLSVNDAPSFVSGGNVTIPEDSAPYNALWATSISPGPANELSQTVTFSVTTSNQALFDVQPSINSLGNLSFTPRSNTSGTSSITVTLQDNGGVANGGINTSAPVVFSIILSGENDAPVAVNDFYTVLEGGSLTASPGGSPAGVLDNDQDPDGDVLNATVILAPKNSSSYSLLSNGTLFYVHNGSETLSDSLKYTVFDGTVNSNVATVYLTITKTNDPPVAVGIDDIINVEDAPLQLVDLLSAFMDPDNTPDALTYAVTNTTNPLLFDDLNVNEQTGKLELNYAQHQNGSSTVTVRASDPGGLTASTSFRVTLTPVNDPPTMNPGPDITLDEDPGAQSIPNWATNVVAGPADESGQIITPGVTVSNPALFNTQPKLSINGTNGTLTFTPAAQTNGQSSVTITLTDNGGGANTSSYAFLITIQGDNDKPTSLPIDDIVANEDAASVTLNLFDYFSDVEDADADLVFSIEGDYDETLFEQLSIDGTPKILTINYAEDAYGETAISIRATDTGGLFAQEDVKITLNPVNDAPSFTPGSDVAVSQNSGAFSAQWAENISVGPANEASQEPFFTVSITNGMDNLFGVQPAISPAGVLSFTPAIGDQVFGDADVSVILGDDGGTENGGVSQSVVSTFKISIRRLNTAPLGNTDNYIVDQGQTLQVGASIGVLANDTDVEGDNLTARLVNGPANASAFTLNADGSFSYQHNNSNSTNDAFTYVANDGFDDSNVTTVAISIQPSGTLSLAEIKVLEDAENSEIDVRRALALSAGYGYSISGISNENLFSSVNIDSLAGILSVNYAPNQAGVANINIAITSSEGDDIIATQKITILAVNDVPIAVNDIAATIENRSIEIDVISNDVDFDNDNLTLLRFSNPTRGTVQAQLNGNLLYTPETNFTGLATFTYSIRDDSLASAEGLVTITVFAGRFVVSALGLPNSTTSAAYNISNAGEVVGAFLTGGAVQAFSSNQVIPQDNPGEALDANDFGQIVGATTFESPGNTGPVFQATLWDTAGVTNLGSFDGRISKAYSINNAAQIAGMSSKQNSNLFHATLWVNGIIQPLEAEDGQESEAFDINEQGLITGYVGSSAVIWRDELIQRRLNGPEGRAYAINSRGQTAGSIKDGEVVKAIFWNDDGRSTSLHLDGSVFSEAYGVNNSTWVVGGYLPAASGKTTATGNTTSATNTTPAVARKADLLDGILDRQQLEAGKKSGKSTGALADAILSANNDMRAFLWQGDTILDLNDFIDEASGWVLLEARAINNAAQITGVGLFNGERQAFLLSPTINKKPTAVADQIIIANLSPVTIEVLNNDADADGDTLRITSVTQGAFGVVTIKDNHQIIYEPGNGFTDRDAFTYVIEDGKGGLAEGAVEILIDATNLPRQFTLAQNYPNPFNPRTTITFGLPEQAEVTIEVYNMLGQRISTLVDGLKSAGTHTVVFDAANLPGGVYVYRLRTPAFEQARQLILLK